MNAGDMATSSRLISACTAELLNGNADYSKMVGKVREAVDPKTDKKTADALWQAADADFAKAAAEELKFWRGIKQAEKPASLCKLNIDTDNFAGPNVSLSGSDCK